MSGMALDTISSVLSWASGASRGSHGIPVPTANAWGWQGNDTKRNLRFIARAPKPLMAP